MSRKGKIIQCVQTGKYYPSMVSAAKEVLGYKTGSSVWNSVMLGKPCKGFDFIEIPYDVEYEKIGEDDSICWICQNTHMEYCTWFNPDNPQPVDGWQAEKVYLPCSENQIMVGYIVKKCPNFLKEEWYKWEV